MGSRPEVELRLLVNPVACEAVGLCAHLAPDLVVLDRWGYPITSDEPVRAERLLDARRAVKGCPRQALMLSSVTTTAAGAPGP
jgi:ferredoxin